MKPNTQLERRRLVEKTARPAQESGFEPNLQPNVGAGLVSQINQLARSNHAFPHELKHGRRGRFAFEQQERSLRVYRFVIEEQVAQ